MKKVEVTSRFFVPQEVFWEEILQVKNLFYVTKGFVSFGNKHSFPLTWDEGRTIRTTVRPFGLGKGMRYWIDVNLVDFDRFNITTTEESDGVIRRWQHVMKVRSTYHKDTCIYTDTVEVDAGSWTPFFAMYVKIYYTYRHWRWKRLLNKKYVRTA